MQRIDLRKKTSFLLVLRLSWYNEQNSQYEKEKEDQEEGGGAVHVVHAADDDEVEDDDEEVEQQDHLHDEHAGLLRGRSGVHPGEDGGAEVGGRLETTSYVPQRGPHRGSHTSSRAGASCSVQRTYKYQTN